MLLIRWVVIIFISSTDGQGLKPLEKYDGTTLQNIYGGNIHHALYHITKGFPAKSLAIIYDKNTDGAFITHLVDYLLKNEISIFSFNITTPKQQDAYFSFLTATVNNYYDLYSVHFCGNKLSEHILIQFYENKIIRRNLIFMFYWGQRKMYRFFIRNMHETMKIIVITNPRRDAYRLYYNQATSYKRHNLQMINWWIQGRGLFHHPTLPKSRDTFKDFHGRVIPVPVIHKPPWHFVKYSNESAIVLGGRDDKLLQVLAQRLNFQFEYFDPPERIQGTSFNVNGTFDGVLGLIWEKEVEFFIGDIALTEERFKAVEFSFLTLADSGAFVTHAPSKLNEALALIRPFNPSVWPAIIFTVLLSGPVLYLIIALPNMWHPKFIVQDHGRLFFDCCWYTVGIFFKQTGRSPSESNKSRFIIILLAVSATYVIGDMYAANLTSLLARPGREKPIENLWQLENAMATKGYKLLVEKFSSSYSLLENGTGIYGRLWEIMNWDIKSPNSYLVDSVETGVKRVRDRHNIAVMAGRETLFFDTQRFGSSNFHLSEKLNTAYSAIALQLGCPYKWNFNNILMGIFESGILTKMTEDEYENLGKQQSVSAEPNVPPPPPPGTSPPDEEDDQQVIKKRDDDSQRLQPLNIRMLQGAFYLLGIGHLISGMVVGFEILCYRHKTSFKRRHRNFGVLYKAKKRVKLFCMRIVNYIRRKFREAMNDAIIATLDYIE